MLKKQPELNTALPLAGGELQSTETRAAQPSEALPGASEPAVLDVAALDRLRELDPTGENRLMERVVSAFDSSAQRLMPQLSDALAAGDMAGIRHVAHTLKSSSASIGAMTLSQLCAEVELMARQSQTDGLDVRANALSAEVDSVSRALKRLLGA